MLLWAVDGEEFNVPVLSFFPKCTLVHFLSLIGNGNDWYNKYGVNSH
jgi:hypothetical protein